MSQTFTVNVLSRKLRSATINNPNTGIAILPFGCVVTKLEEHSDPAWWKVSTIKADGSTLVGFIEHAALVDADPPPDVAPPPQALIDFSTSAAHDVSQLGVLSRLYESKGSPAAIGYDTNGGWSFGTYQLSSKQGSLEEFLAFVAQRSPDQANTLVQAGGHQAGLNGEERFKSAWKDLARDPDFAVAQHEFIKRAHYEPLSLKLPQIGLNVPTRSKALKDVVWSVAVQHGVGGGFKLFKSALAALGQADLDRDEQVIKALYAERSRLDVHFISTTDPAVKTSLLKRFANERSDALSMLA